MGSTLAEIAQQLKDNNKKVQLIYAFNGAGKTQLSREFRRLVTLSNANENDAGDVEQSELTRTKILYYNAYTEDLFYWDNDLTQDSEPKLKIQPNSFTEWVLKDQGQDQNVITNFQRYTDEKLTPYFNEDFTEVTFSFERGHEDRENNIKISKGEESNFVWSIFYTLLELIIETLNIPEESERDTDQFNQLEYVFIDDPVSSLDENHLIELAVDVARLIKISESGLKFIITTHNPLFYNVLFNELRDRRNHTKYILKKDLAGEYELKHQSSDSPFSYHLYLKAELETAIDNGQIYKYHYNFLRNILEKTSTFLGYQQWGDLLEPVRGERSAYERRMINLSSHSKHAGEEVVDLEEDDKRVLGLLVREISEIYHFKASE